MAGRRARRRHELKVVFVAAFSMIDLWLLSAPYLVQTRIELPINGADDGGDKKPSRSRGRSISSDSQA